METAIPPAAKPALAAASPVAPSAGTGPTLVASPKALAQPVAITVQLPPERHDYTGDVISGAVGLIGALLGAYAAYRFGTVAAKKAKDAEDRERDLFLSFSVIHKLQKIYPKELSILSSIRESEKARDANVKAAAEAGDPLGLANLCFYMTPFANKFERVHFTAEEVIGAGKVGGKDVLNALMTIDEAYNLTVDLIEDYARRKAEFSALTGMGHEFKDGMMSYSFTDERIKPLRPLLWLMDKNIEEIRRGAQKESRVAYEALLGLAQGRVKLQKPDAFYVISTSEGGNMRVTAAGATLEEGEKEVAEVEAAKEERQSDPR